MPMNGLAKLEAYNYAINGWVQELNISRPDAQMEVAFVKAKVHHSQHSTAPPEACRW